jgi:hypothetical protein
MQHGGRGAWALITLLSFAGLGTGCSQGPAPATAPDLPAAQSSVAQTSEPAAAQESRYEDLGPSDLSICSRKAAPGSTPKSTPDLAEFARQLNGTWKLSNRTIRGLTIDTNTFFYFDLPSTSQAEVKGTAMLIDYGNLSVLDPMNFAAACLADATVEAMWDVQIGRKEPASVSLVMNGEYFGSYGDFLKGIHATESSVFAQFGQGFLSGKLTTPGGGQGVEDDVWDRIGLSAGTLTYVSCTGGYVERYVKISDERPLIEGMSLRENWEKRKQDGSVVRPIPVVPAWRESVPGAKK